MTVICAFFLVAPAAAATFVVDTVKDSVDNQLGDDTGDDGIIVDLGGAGRLAQGTSNPQCL
ncbi:MAG TPA: hypothetical protein ENN66_00370 [Proteobacteria bacterium]|nr:hypothetical protein [Pseudomonadota bacterium]